MEDATELNATTEHWWMSNNKSDNTICNTMYMKYPCIVKKCRKNAIPMFIEPPPSPPPG